MILALLLFLRQQQGVRTTHIALRLRLYLSASGVGRKEMCEATWYLLGAKSIPVSFLDQSCFSVNTETSLLSWLNLVTVMSSLIPLGRDLSETLPSWENESVGVRKAQGILILSWRGSVTPKIAQPGLLLPLPVGDGVRMEGWRCLVMSPWKSPLCKCGCNIHLCEIRQFVLCAPRICASTVPTSHGDLLSLVGSFHSLVWGGK